MKESILRAISTQQDRFPSAAGDSEELYQPPDGVYSTTTDSAGFKNNIYSWGGQFHYVPENFVFPSCHTSNLWSLWLMGDPAAHIRPYRHIEPFDLTTKASRVQRSKAAHVMNFMLSCLSKDEKTLLLKRTATSADRNVLFTKAWAFVCETIHPGETTDELDGHYRLGSRKYTTISDLLHEVLGNMSAYKL